MRIVGCGLIAVAALLGLAPTAMASELADGSSSASAQALPSSGSAGEATAAHQPGPHTGVSLLAVSLTAGAAVAAAGSGVAQAVNRRRAHSRAPGQAPQDAVRL
ncbi:MAG: hypothetical protein LC799_04390 [Actinobacteria bacterium]|nr:hypothetical protein [Actinomycetota bacterium]